MAKYGTPDIFNTGKSSKFTRFAFTHVLLDNGIRISIDGLAVGWTTCLSNNSGALSDMKTFTRTLRNRFESPRGH